MFAPCRFGSPDTLAGALSAISQGVGSFAALALSAPRGMPIALTFTSPAAGIVLNVNIMARPAEARPPVVVAQAARCCHPSAAKPASVAAPQMADCSLVKPNSMPDEAGGCVCLPGFTEDVGTGDTGGLADVATWQALFPRAAESPDAGAAWLPALQPLGVGLPCANGFFKWQDGAC